MRRLALLFLCAGVVGLTLPSCVNLLEPRPTNTKYYLLESPLEATSSSDSGLRVGLRKPRLAEYLDTPSLVTREGPNEIHFSEFHRWGENLGAALNRVVALNLETQPGIQSVEEVPWPQGASFDYVVQLRVLRFEGVGSPPAPDADEDGPPPTGHSQMVVEWSVFDSSGDSLRTRGRTQHRIEGWTVTRFSDLVSKLDTSLVVLAEDIGTRLNALPSASRQQ